MKSQAFIFLLVGLLLDISGTAVAMKRSEAVSPQMTAASNMPATGSMPVMNMGSDSSSSSKANDGSMTDSSMTMDDMMTNLQGKTGDEFDKAFLSEMITHHQGAISMAQLAATQAKHQEVKDLATAIVSAQTSEISQMEAWQKSWGYAK